MASGSKHSIYRVFAMRLREHRRRAGLSLEQLGEQAGITGAFVAHIEAERKRPTLETVAKLAWALGTTTDRLLEEGPRAGRKGDGHVEQFARLTRGMTPKQKDALLALVRAAAALTRDP